MRVFFDGKNKKKDFIKVSNDLIESSIKALLEDKSKKIEDKEKSLPEFFKNSIIETNKGLPFFFRKRVTDKNINKMVEDELNSFGHHCFKDAINKKYEKLIKKIELMRVGVTIEEFNILIKELKAVSKPIAKAFQNS